MRPLIAFIVAGALTSEAIAEPFLEARTPPHTEQGTRVSELPEHATDPLSSTRNPEPLGHLTGRVLYAETHAARIRKNKLAMLDAYVETAHALLRDRALEPWERLMQYNILRHDIDMIRLRTRNAVDYSAALPAVAAALGIPIDSVKA